MPYREQIKGERLGQGKTVRAYIIEVLDTVKGPQVILSRSHPGFLKALFHQEVPEIQEGIVSIKGVAREPGTRSKIAVSSNDERVDPVGSCVGMKGSRVQAVTRELAGERVDIVPWSAEPSLLISRALSPAVVANIILHRERNEATVIVNDDQLSKAIGKEGKNVRLAAKLTEWKIDLISSREHSTRQRVTEDMSMPLADLPGVTEDLLVILEALSVTSIDELANTPLERLAAIESLDAEGADSLLATAQATRDELKRMIDKTVKSDLETEAAEVQALFADDVFTEESTVEVSEEDQPLSADAAEVMFKDFPTGDEDADGEASKAGDDDDEEKKIDPFANTELED